MNINDESIDKYLNEKRKRDRKRYEFRNSPLLSNSPVVIYMDYLIQRREDTSENPEESNYVKTERHREKRDLSKVENELSHIDKKRLREDLENYIEKFGPNIRRVEKQFEERVPICFTREPIYAAFSIEPDDKIEEKEVAIWTKMHATLLPDFRNCLHKMFNGADRHDNFQNEIAFRYLVNLEYEICQNLGTPQEDSHANELALYMLIYRAMADEVVYCATKILSEPLLHSFIYFYRLYLKMLPLSDDREALAALVLQSTEKAMHYFGSYLLFNGYLGNESIPKKVTIAAKQLILPDTLMYHMCVLSGLENRISVDSSIFKKFDATKLETAIAFINSQMGKMLYLSENSVIDIVSAYNFLFSGKDYLSFRNRLKDKGKGYKTYCVQSYVRRFMNFEHEANKRGLVTKDEYKKLGAEYLIEPSEELLAAMRVFSIYREHVIDCLRGKDKTKELIEEMRIVTTRSIGSSILRYNAIETIKSNTDFLTFCMEALYDLYHYGEVRPICNDSE